MFEDLLIRPDLPHIFLSDVNTLLDSISREFPGVAQVESIGTTWENREIRMLTIDSSMKPKKVVAKVEEKKPENPMDKIKEAVNEASQEEEGQEKTD